MGVVKIRFAKVKLTKKLIAKAMSNYFKEDTQHIDFLNRLDKHTDSEIKLLTYEDLYRKVFNKDESAFIYFLQSKAPKREIEFNIEELSEEDIGEFKATLNYELLKILKKKKSTLSSYGVLGATLKRDIYTICTKRKIKYKEIEAVLNELDKVDKFKKSLDYWIVHPAR